MATHEPSSEDRNWGVGLLENHQILEVPRRALGFRDVVSGGLQIDACA